MTSVLKIGFWGIGVLSVVLVSGCSIKNDVPGFRYPSRVDSASRSWPTLVETDELLQAGDIVRRDPVEISAENDRFADRIRRLRARAQALRNAQAN